MDRSGGSVDLKPNLSHPFAESRYLGNPLQILAVGIAVDLEVCMENLDLLFCERCSDSLCLLLLMG